MSNTDIEESLELNLQYDKNGLIPVVVQEMGTGEILMFAYCNAEAFKLTLESNYATFWSRSRQKLWKKGESSGNLMVVKEILTDCDQDCLIFKVVKSLGGACHTLNEHKEFRHSCFYRKINHNTKNLDYYEK